MENRDFKIMRMLGLHQKEKANEKKLIVWTDDGIMKGKAYCKKEDIAKYLEDVMIFPTNRLRVVIQKEQ
ncbi:MAG: hypothetical protein M1504_00115 [Candidatus Marsarchaeota archaeon]|nr:hypothetical protein [Candidatus Marsarchaeota archaeon]